MRSTYRLLIGAAAAMFVSGCALQDSRYDNSRLAAGLGDYDESIIDWNFPTSTNQGLLLPPERLRPWRPAIGVPWATPSDTPPFRPNLAPAREGASAPETGDDARHGCTRDCGVAPPRSRTATRQPAKERNAAHARELTPLPTRTAS